MLDEAEKILAEENDLIHIDDEKPSPPESEFPQEESKLEDTKEHSVKRVEKK